MYNIFMDKPDISRVMVEFFQEGNTLGTTGEDEVLELCLEFQGSEEAGPFYVIKTNGWSFDSLADLQVLIDRASVIIATKAN